MKEILLCKYGEVVLKGLNKSYFEGLMVRELTARLAKVGEFVIRHAQSTIYVEPQDDFISSADMDLAVEEASHVFGIVMIHRAYVVEKDIEAIRAALRELAPRLVAGAKTFKGDAKRSDKRFPLNSMDLMAEVGAAVLDACPYMKVDVKHPDVTVRVEIRDTNAYIHAGGIKGAGGLPTGSSGHAMLLLSGGIDSPVAGYMMAKRGAGIEAVHFESFPYTSERAREKVLELARLVSIWCGKIKVHVASLTHVQEELKRTCNEEYFTLLLRRCMMRSASRLAREHACPALVTGESLGQVASQTMHALSVTDAVADRPVFRPCIGMDKEEIVALARKIGTFETSILPYEDCCTVFTPRHPKTKPELEKVEAEEAKLDLAALEEEVAASVHTYVFKYGELLPQRGMDEPGEV